MAGVKKVVTDGLQTVGMVSTMLVATAVMKTIILDDTGVDWQARLKRLMSEQRRGLGD